MSLAAFVLPTSGNISINQHRKLPPFYRRCRYCCSSGLFWKVIFLVAPFCLVGQLITIGIKSTTTTTNLVNTQMDLGIPSNTAYTTSNMTTTTLRKKRRQRQQQQLLSQDVPSTSKSSALQSKPSTKTSNSKKVVTVVTWKNRTVTPVPDAIQYFYNEVRSDRSGAMIIDMLMAHAFSWLSNRTYGGVCGRRHLHSNDHRRMIQVLELSHILPYPTTKTLPRCHELNASVAWALPRVAYNQQDSKIFTPEWIQYIRQQQQQQQQEARRQRQQPSNQPEQQPSSQQPLPSSQLPPQQQLLLRSELSEWHRIIVYIRRGDVTPCIKANFRYLPNSHYLTLIEKYTTPRHYNTTIITDGNNNNHNIFYDVTIYSESNSFEGWQDFYDFFNRTTTTENIIYRLLLDVDMAHVWRDMLGWNYESTNNTNTTTTTTTIIPSRVVFILSRSAFALVPAILAPPSTIVVHTPMYFHEPLPHWHVVDSKLVADSFFRVSNLRRRGCGFYNNTNP